ncbi:MAG TPA: DUF488 domain-containing protein [Candidatus Lokiarchaeia archaeon]
MIRVDCYLAKLNEFKKKYPDSHFEVITRTTKSPLSPSWKLLNKSKEMKMPFDVYLTLLEEELKNNPLAQKKIDELITISKSKDIFLVCYEKDPSNCHRSFVKKLIEQKISKNK